MVYFHQATDYEQRLDWDNLIVVVTLVSEKNKKDSFHYSFRVQINK